MVSFFRLNISGGEKGSSPELQALKRSLTYAFWLWFGLQCLVYGIEVRNEKKFWRAYGPSRWYLGSENANWLQEWRLSLKRKEMKIPQSVNALVVLDLAPLRCISVEEQFLSMFTQSDRRVGPTNRPISWCAEKRKKKKKKEETRKNNEKCGIKCNGTIVIIFRGFCGNSTQ